MERKGNLRAKEGAGKKKAEKGESKWCPLGFFHKGEADRSF